MFNSTPAFSLVGALVGASAYARPLAAIAREPIPMLAVECLQRARVDIYCDHRLQAVADIRCASRHLRASGAKVSAQTLATLDEAAWLARRHEHVLAERALDAVLNQIAVGAART